MSLEEQIVEWSLSRPPWQRAILRRIAVGDLLSEEVYDQLLDALVAGREVGDTTFGLQQLPQVAAGDPTVRLVSIAQPEHINALESDAPLIFEASGLTIVYGDNGSGKSGYARLIKRLVRTRHQEEILSDVFRDTALANPKATVTIAVASKEASFSWPDVTPSELQRVLFYDGECGRSYIEVESAFPYRPSALFVMDGLIDACVAIRNRVDAKLADNARRAKALPVVDEELKGTDAGRYLMALSGASGLEALDSIIQKARDQSKETIAELRNEEARLKSGDTTKERRKLTRQAAKLESLRTHLQQLEGVLGHDAIATIKADRIRLETLRGAAEMLAKSLQAEPLPGVGTDPWKELWESARRFSSAHAYPERTFPVIAEDASCVLCQQPLAEAGKERLVRFERFVQDDTQTRLREATRVWDGRITAFTNLRTTAEATETNLSDLEADYPDLMRDTRQLLAGHESVRGSVLQAHAAREAIPPAGLTLARTVAGLGTASEAAGAAADGLSNPEATRQRLAVITTRRKELELLQEVEKRKLEIVAEIARLKERQALEAVKSAAATGPITKKILELSESNITEVVRDAFTRETDRLHLERVTIAKTRGDRGALLHQPKLVGVRQDVPLPRVFSEGERSALGIAAFFTEAQLHASKSALVLDDPVSSLDHVRRGHVARRLATLAEGRQVIVFTHDVAFVADLKREAKALGVQIGERWVTRGRGGEKKPGACRTSHPWKAKDVGERLGELGAELARIRRDCQGWDPTTYENEVALWAGKLSETWERIFSQEVVGPVLAEGGLEVRPNMVRILVSFSPIDEREFQASYSNVSQWAARHDKSGMVNYVAPEVDALQAELSRVEGWFRRVKAYK